MKIPLHIRVAALGSATLDVEVEIADDVLRGLVAPREFLTDGELRQRWGCSSRTLKRLRDERRLPFQQPAPRLFRYRLSDVEQYEREHRTEAGVLRPGRRAAR